MSSVKVAVRVRPFNNREIDMESNFIIRMDGKKTSIFNPKSSNDSNNTDRNVKEFTYDFSYWSVDKNEEEYDSQETIFNDLGQDVIKSAYEGYNACIFAYGQTGSGKTYTMTGNDDDKGLIPKICETLFNKMNNCDTTYRTIVSYLEIYNEKVRDLLKPKAEHSLKVREHPKEGPYVQDLSKHIVENYDDIYELMNSGNRYRTTAATNMNETSSRSHAIFTVSFTQAKFSSGIPSETNSKIHLVDLAGSERADATGATGQRLKEGGSINRLLTALGKVISALADRSINSQKDKKNTFIPYRDSVLTWLLKDSLGGNSKTIMIAAISPADVNYTETLSTLRFANRAKNIINKPTVNEDPNVKLIRDLRTEIERLKSMIGNNINSVVTPHVQEKLHENEAKIKELTQEWQARWHNAAQILKSGEGALDLSRQGTGVVLHSHMPHLIGIDEDLLSTGIALFHIKQGVNRIGLKSDNNINPDIELTGDDVLIDHCIIENMKNGSVFIEPKSGAFCTVNGNVITNRIQLKQGAVICLGEFNMFRFNHPSEAAKLRDEIKNNSPAHHTRKSSALALSMTDLARSCENLMSSDDIELQEKKFKRRSLACFDGNFNNSNNDSCFELRADDLENDNYVSLEKQLFMLQKERSKYLDALECEQNTTQKRLKKLNEEVLKNSEILSECETDVLKKKLNLQTERNREKDLVQHDRELLKQILKGEDIDGTVVDEMDDETRDRLLSELELIKETRLELKDRETDLLNQYKENENSVYLQHESQNEEIVKRKQQLETDKICLQECENNLEVNGNREDIESFEKEMSAVEQERLRIVSESQRILEEEECLDNVLKSRLEQLQTHRDDQIKELNVFRDEIKLIDEKRQDFIKELVHRLDEEEVRIQLREEDDVEEIKEFERQIESTKRLAKERNLEIEFERKGIERVLQEKRENILNSVRIVDEKLDELIDKAPTNINEINKDNNNEAINPSSCNSENDLTDTLKTFDNDSNSNLTEENFDIKSGNLQEIIERQVRKRLLEERIHLEKSRQKDREIERQLRQQELYRLKEAYCRELKRLKNGENSNCTDANPFATLMVQSGSDSWLEKSVEYTNELEKLESVSSVESPNCEIFVNIPQYIMRSSGLDTHYDFEVFLAVGHDQWTVYRRYSRFCQLHKELSAKYIEISQLALPPKKWFVNLSEKIVNQRRKQLESYLQTLIKLVRLNPASPLHHANVKYYSKYTLINFNEFFRKGLFEPTKHSTT